MENIHLNGMCLSTLAINLRCPTFSGIYGKTSLFLNHSTSQLLSNSDTFWDKNSTNKSNVDLIIGCGHQQKNK